MGLPPVRDLDHRGGGDVITTTESLAQLDQELIDERGIAGHRIADQVLADPKANADDFPRFGYEAGRLDPEVVSIYRRTRGQQCHGQQRRNTG